MLLVTSSDAIEPTAHALGFETEGWRDVYTYDSRELPDPPRGKEIMRLDASMAQEVYDLYDHRDWYDTDSFRVLLDEGRFQGGFNKEGELVGYCGEHSEGSIGLIQVLPEYRRQGWATALMRAKINEHLGRGWTPWSAVLPDNEISSALQGKVGMNKRCACLYLSREGSAGAAQSSS